MEKPPVHTGSPLCADPLSPEDLHYWDIASKYWKDVVTVNPYWAWESFYSRHIPHTELTILILGVTNGVFLELIKKFRPCSQVYAIDFSFEMIKNVQKIERKIICCRGDHLPFREGSFDIVLSDYFLSVVRGDVLESVVKEIDRCLRKEGIFMAKELRHRGHMAAWMISLFIMGFSSVILAFLHPVLSLVLIGLSIPVWFIYDPFHKEMGKTSALFKFFIHVFRFILKRKQFPTSMQIHELYFLSKKHLNIFPDRTLHTLFEKTSLDINLDRSLLSWNFSIIGKKNSNHTE